MKRGLTLLFHGVCFLLLMSMSSCLQIDLYEKNTPIPNYAWKQDFEVKGSFEIKDIASANNLFIILRHTDKYTYNNIWLNLGIQNPGDSMYFQKINIELGNDATGWYGSGMNDIWEYRYKLTPIAKPFIKKGIYNFSIKQIMRDDPLPNVMSAGFRIEKAVN